MSRTKRVSWIGFSHADKIDDYEEKATKHGAIWVKTAKVRRGSPRTFSSREKLRLYLLAKDFRDNRAGTWNAPASYRRTLNRVWRAKQNQKLRRAVVRQDDFDNFGMDKKRRSANALFW